MVLVVPAKDLRLVVDTIEEGLGRTERVSGWMLECDCAEVGVSGKGLFGVEERSTTEPMELLLSLELLVPWNAGVG